VKNNFQIVTSLVSLQETLAGSFSMHDAYKELEGRIRTMALIHEMLYQSEEIETIDFSIYANRLAAHVVNAFSEDRTPSVRILGEGVLATIGTSIPLGLIMNELIANACKYAFRDSHADAGMSRIDIEIDGLPEKGYSLVVKDNGTGFPPGFDPRDSRTLGMQLVRALAAQLSGTASAVSTPHGVCWTVRIPPEPASEPGDKPMGPSA
jgi:two-component sensor histidine kinase